MKKGVPFSFKITEDIITEEKQELVPFIFEEADDSNYRVKLDIEDQLVAKLPQREYGENEFSYRQIYLDEFIDEDNIDKITEIAVEEIQEYIEEDND